jgi:hypothetical protein
MLIGFWENQIEVSIPWNHITEIGQIKKNLKYLDNFKKFLGPFLYLSTLRFCVSQVLILAEFTLKQFIYSAQKASFNPQTAFNWANKLVFNATQVGSKPPPVIFTDGAMLSS